MEEEDDFDLNIDFTSDEHLRLGGKEPLSTIVDLSIGPLISQFASALYGVIDSMWVSKYVGEIGLTVMSLSFVIDSIILAFGFFVNTAVATKIAYLFSKNKHDIANQVVSDLIRLSLMIGLLLPFILLPTCKTLIRWYGASEDVINLSYDFMIPLIFGTFICTLFYTVCGVLQGEGRSWWYAGTQVLSMLLNSILFDPLLLSIFKKVWGASIATRLSQLIPTIIVIVVLYNGKLTCKPSFSMLLEPFHPQTFSAIKTGFSSLIMHISIAIPSTIMQRFIGIAATAIGKFDIVMAVFNAVIRLYNLSLCTSIALNTAYLPAASYSFGRKLYARILDLTYHVFWISFVWGMIVTLIVCIFPNWVSSIFSTDPDFIYYSSIILPISFYTIVICSLKFVLISFLQATLQTTTASVLSFVIELFPLPGFAALMHYTSPQNDPTRVFYAYIWNDIFTFIICIIVVLPSWRMYITLSDQNNVSDSNIINDIEIIPEL